VSYISSTADTSVFLQVLEQIDPANVDAVSLMNDVFSNQLQLAASVVNLQGHSITTDGDLNELAESVAANTLPRLTIIKEELEELI
jgi:hypothetical protein